MSIEYPIPAGLSFEEIGRSSRQKLGPDYHPSIAGPDDEFRGKTWRDMPGSDNENRKMNFFLFRRGLFVLPDSGERKDIARVFTGGAPGRKGKGGK